MKIAVMGYSGAGKSTLAKALSDHYQCPLLYLDMFNFEPGWVERDPEKGREIVARFMQNSSWVIDGNYAHFYQLQRLQQADCIIWMNYARVRCFFRALKRYYRHKGRARESCAPGCVEKFDWAFAWWILWAGRTREKRAHYRQIVEQYAPKVVILKNDRQVARFFKNLP